MVFLGRRRETVFIFKACWLVSDLNYHIFGYSSCEINSDAQAEEDDIFDTIEKRINDMSESEWEAMRKQLLAEMENQIKRNEAAMDDAYYYMEGR